LFANCFLFPIKTYGIDFPGQNWVFIY